MVEAGQQHAVTSLMTESTERSLATTERLTLVRRIMETLPEKQRTAMQLRDFEGKTYKEIAAIMEITEEQVKVSIFRARQTVKAKILRRGEDE